MQQRAIEYEQMPQGYQMFHLVNATRQSDLNDIQTDLRNILTSAKIYGVSSQNAISIRGSAEDLAMAQRMITELDQPRKVYRLTYTITETDGGKKVRSEKFSLVVLAGERATLKQGLRAPIVTGSYDAESSKANTQVQYVDPGIEYRCVVGWRTAALERLSSRACGRQGAVERTGSNDSADGAGCDVEFDDGEECGSGRAGSSWSTRHEEVECAAELVRR